MSRADRRNCGPHSGDPAEQAIDLLAGLEISQPLCTGSGFFIDAEGTVLTHALNVAECGRISLNDRYTAILVNPSAARTGALAVLTPMEPLAPATYGQLTGEPIRLGQSVAVAE